MAGTHRDRSHKSDSHDAAHAEYQRESRDRRDHDRRTRDTRNTQQKQKRHDKNRDDWQTDGDGYYMDHEKRGMEYSAQRLKDPAAHLLFRTKLCKFFSLGACTRGPQCAFAHDYSVLRHTPNLSKTSLCPQLMKYGTCGKGEECNYAHSKAELRSAADNLPLKRSEEHVPAGFKSRPTHRSDKEVAESPLSANGREHVNDFQPRHSGKFNVRHSNSLDGEIMKLPTNQGQFEPQACVAVRSPLRAPFSSPVRLPEMPLSTPHFCPTSPPWRPLTPSIDDSASLDGRQRFDSLGCVVVKNTFLEFVTGEEETSEKDVPLRRKGTSSPSMPQLYRPLLDRKWSVRSGHRTRPLSLEREGKHHPTCGTELTLS